MLTHLPAGSAPPCASSAVLPGAPAPPCGLRCAQGTAAPPCPAAAHTRLQDWGRAASKERHVSVKPSLSRMPLIMAQQARHMELSEHTITQFPASCGAHKCCGPGRAAHTLHMPKWHLKHSWSWHHSMHAWHELCCSGCKEPGSPSLSNDSANEPRQTGHLTRLLPCCRCWLLHVSKQPLQKSCPQLPASRSTSTEAAIAGVRQQSHTCTGRQLSTYCRQLATLIGPLVPAVSLCQPHHLRLFYSPTTGSSSSS